MFLEKSAIPGLERIMMRLLGLFVFLLSVYTPVHAGDNEELDSIYRLFMQNQLDMKSVDLAYADNVIHVNTPNQPLLQGKQDFLEINITPMKTMVDSGQLKVNLTAYVTRRVITGEMANDVGYLHTAITMPDGEIKERVRKFSWVFLKQGGVWKVITDFDATQAPLDVVKTESFERVVGIKHDEPTVQ
jgi:ketosteroid isomerase-like protein